MFWRRHPDLNRGIKVLQTLTLPLGYSAINWWLDQESNQGHVDFQSTALPTELSSHITWRRPTLPQGHPCSTIGALKLNRPVRYGKGCYLHAIITRYENINILSKLHSEFIFSLTLQDRLFAHAQSLRFFLQKKYIALSLF